MPRNLIPGSINFPGWEISAVLVGWNPLCVSATMAIARIVADIQDTLGDSSVLITGAFVLLVLQIPWVVLHAWFVHRHLKVSYLVRIRRIRNLSLEGLSL